MYVQSLKVTQLHGIHTETESVSDCRLILEVPFSGREISFISLLLVTNSKIHDMVT
jgi:hypothetical protein